MKFLYISNTRNTQTPYRDGSTRYRCYNFAEQWTAKHHIAHVTTLERSSLALAAQYDVVIFLRPERSKKLLAILSACRQHNVLAVADFDDLLFRPELAHQAPSVLTGRAPQAQIEKLYESHIQALSLFNYVTVATQALKTHIDEIMPDINVHVLSNGLSEYWLDYNQHAPWKQSRNKQLLYLPGSHSHDRDFQTIEHVLIQLLEHDSELTLKLIGKLAADLGALADSQVIRGEQWIEFVQLPEHICSATACLAPLSNTVFNQCKSHIKFIEAAAFGTPLIASPIPDMERHAVEGLFFPNTPEQWTVCIEKLQNPDYFHHCRESLYQYARMHCTNAQAMPALTQFYQTALSEFTDAYITDITKAA